MTNIENNALNEKTPEETKKYSACESAIPSEFEDSDLTDTRITELEDQLLEAKKNEHDARDSFLRATAEMENVRRRTEIDIEKAHKFALERFSSDLLSIIDNLERALEVADKKNPKLVAMIEGIELTLKSLQNVVRKYGIEIISEINVPFNPDVHQAMSLIESIDYKPNHVMMVMQKGYTLNGRLLRPAMVVVSKSKV